MAKERGEPNRDIVPVKAPEGVPSYLAEFSGEQDTSLNDMQAYRILPRLKVIQGTAKQELLKQYDPGTIILSPANVKVADVDKKEQCSSDPFLFVPLFFFVEFCKWADLKDKSSNSIVDRTFDPGSDIAAKSRDKNQRTEEYGEKKQFKYRYVEHLNFAGFIYAKNDGSEHPLKGEACCLHFERGEFGKGTSFITAASMRRGLPLWSQVWELTAGFRPKSDDKKWWGIDFSIPLDEKLRVIKPDEVAFFKATHEELKSLHAKKKLVVDASGGDDDADEAARAAAASAKDM